MKPFEKIIKKSWVIGAAAIMIASSTTIMAFALDDNLTQNGHTDVPASVSAAADVSAASTQLLTVPTKPVYTVVDQTKLPIDIDELKTELINVDGMTPEKAEEAYKDVMASMIPDEKDMTADQAAAYCAAIVVKAYGVDLTGYRAVASFSKNPFTPNIDNWEVIFHPKNETDSSVRYITAVNSVTGAMLDAGLFDRSFRYVRDKNLTDPAWITAAEKSATVLLPQGVKITSSQIASAMELSGVTVVFNLSDGSAMGVRVTGENKTAVVHIVFPNGYDGSLDYDGDGNVEAAVAAG